MKKRILSMAVMLLLLLSIVPAAHADITYPSPGDVMAGSQFQHLVAEVSLGSLVSVAQNTLPPGVSLITEDTAAYTQIYLSGTPSVVGSYSVMISVEYNNSTSNILCTVKVVPATPTVGISSDVRCYLNEHAELKVSASSSDNGMLSYQWYSNHINNVSSGTLISGATSDVYQPPTSTVGTSYYYCIVTNTNNGQTAYAISPTAAVQVESAQLSSISVHTLPRKTEYTLGETLDTSGLVLSLHSAGGNITTITEGFTASPSKLDTVGLQTITLSYQGLSCTYTVNVKAAEEVIEGIGVLTLPRKTIYALGDTLDTSGLSIRVYTNSGHRDVSSGLDCSPSLLDKAGQQTITVSYGGKTCTFTVQVTEENLPVSLAVAKLPDKVSYNLGESLDTTGLVLKLSYTDGSSQEISTGFTCSPTRLAQAGRQEIVVTYDEFECRFNVTVLDESLESPSPSPAETPLPSASVQPDSSQSHKPNINGVLLVVIIVTAVLALGGLVVYVFVLNRNGSEDFVKRVKALIDRFRKR